ACRRQRPQAAPRQRTRRRSEAPAPPHCHADRIASRKACENSRATGDPAQSTLLLHALRRDAEPQLAQAEDHERERERNNIIEQPEQQEPGEQLLLVELDQRDQHRGVEHAEPAGEWLAKPSSVAETKMTASLMKSMCGSSGSSTYIASAQQARSTMPMVICSSVSGPPGSATSQLLRPTTRGLVQTQAT